MNVAIDMNLSPDWDAFLTRAGFVSVHWSDEGPPNATDADVLRWAADNDYIVLTADWDVPALLGAERPKPSVVLLGSGILTPDHLGEAVLKAIRQSEKELSVGTVIAVAIT
jgi:predicted nuclease of predicted toxin-antitoxin system